MLRLSLSSFKPGNLRCVKVWFYAFSVKFDQGSLKRPKGIAVYFTFSANHPHPHPIVLMQVKEKPQNYLLVAISLLPTFHFLPPPYIFDPSYPSSLLFPGHFSLLPIMYLPPPYYRVFMKVRCPWLCQQNILKAFDSVAQDILSPLGAIYMKGGRS